MTANGSLYQRGLAVRRDVLGADHVERSLALADSFMEPVQQLVTEFCWGSVWSRSGLSRRDRSLLNLVMLTALNRPHELRVHVRGAVTNGCTAGEIREALLQATVYCGMPAGLDAFRVAKEVLDELSSAGVDVVD